MTQTPLTMQKTMNEEGMVVLTHWNLIIGLHWNRYPPYLTTVCSPIHNNNEIIKKNTSVRFANAEALTHTNWTLCLLFTPGGINRAILNDIIRNAIAESVSNVLNIAHLPVYITKNVSKI